ncbi:MAG: hypothetical protein VKJ66_04255 [Synechococcus sp.]|nr:hypothetical protein [Synechococcus sp.]
MRFSGTLEELQRLVEGLGHPGHWEAKGPYQMFVFDEEQTNLRLNWWPSTGELTLVGDPAERVELLPALETALASASPQQPGSS